MIHKNTQAETYAEILKKVKSNIDIEKLDIRDTRIRRTATGSLLTQIGGENSKHQADALADEMRRVVGEDAMLGRPCRKADIKISGLDEDTTVEDVVDAIMKYGEYNTADIKAGVIRRNRLGEGDVWVKCPWTCAKELCRGGRIKIGWVGARVYMLEQAPRQCFRCFRAGNTGTSRLNVRIVKIGQTSVTDAGLLDTRRWNMTKYLTVCYAKKRVSHINTEWGIGSVTVKMDSWIEENE